MEQTGPAAERVSWRPMTMSELRLYYQSCFSTYADLFRSFLHGGAPDTVYLFPDENERASYSSTSNSYDKAVDSSSVSITAESLSEFFDEVVALIEQVTVGSDRADSIVPVVLTAPVTQLFESWALIFHIRAVDAMLDRYGCTSISALADADKEQVAKSNPVRQTRVQGTGVAGYTDQSPVNSDPYLYTWGDLDAIVNKAFDISEWLVEQGIADNPSVLFAGSDVYVIANGKTKSDAVENHSQLPYQSRRVIVGTVSSAADVSVVEESTWNETACIQLPYSVVGSVCRVVTMLNSRDVDVTRVGIPKFVD